MKNKWNRIGQLLLWSILLLSSISSIKAQDFEWVNEVKESNYMRDWTNPLAADLFGNVFKLYPRGDLEKYNRSGQLLWTKTFAPDPLCNCENSGMEIDALGNVFILQARGSEGVEEPSLLKLDNDGNLIWQKAWAPPNGAAGSMGMSYSTGMYDLTLDDNGDIYIIGEYSHDSLDFDPNVGVLQHSTVVQFQEMTFLMKMDNSGQLSWVKFMDARIRPNNGAGWYDEEFQIKSVPGTNEVYIYVGHQQAAQFDPTSTTYFPPSNGAVVKYDSSGNFIWYSTLNGVVGNFVIWDFTTDNLGNVYLGGNGDVIRTKAILIKVNANGTLAWVDRIDASYNVETWAVATDSENNIYEVGAFAGSPDFDNRTGMDYVLRSQQLWDTYILKRDSSGAFLDVKRLSTGGRAHHILINSFDDMFLWGQFDRTTDFDPSLSDFIRTPTTTNKDYLLKLSSKRHKITGNVYQDSNFDCINNNEIGRSGIIIVAANGQDTTFANTDAFGNYVLRVDTGTYDVFVKNNTPYVYSFCTPIQVVTIDTLNLFVPNIDFGLQVTANCPYLSANISTGLIRGRPSDYHVNYCNTGTAATYNAYVEVTIDTNIIVNSASIPIVSQNGNVYRFDLDTIDIDECGFFLINVNAKPTTPLGQTVCSEVHIYPDSLCGNNWTGPIIQASATCQQDTVFFQLKNSGSNMSTALNYSIFEDHVMLNSGPFTLPSNGSTIISQEADPGKVYRIEAQQAPAIPPYVASPIAHSTVVGCNAINGTILSTGIIPQFYMGNTTPWVDIDCQTVIGSYDPNDKTPQPLGYDTDHYIERGIPIDYKIRFQNTGLDTAFNIVVVDTLSSHLDITTLQMKGSSHTYTWNLSQQGILTVNFINIQLVDTFTNEPLSHGHFSYEIQQKPNLPLGTVIENTAGIYFDFNAPIYTNTTFHTIGENFVTLLVMTTDEILHENIQIEAFPNPFEQMTTLQVSGQDFETLTLEIVDIAGRIVRTEKVLNTSQIVFYRQNLNQGFYFYRLHGNGNLIGSGKLIAQ